LLVNFVQKSVAIICLKGTSHTEYAVKHFQIFLSAVIFCSHLFSRISQPNSVCPRNISGSDDL